MADEWDKFPDAGGTAVVDDPFAKFPDAGQTTAAPDQSFSGQLSSGHYLDALKTGLGTAMKVPARAAYGFATGGAYQPTDQQLETPLVSPEIAQQIAKVPFLGSGINQATDGPAGAIRGGLEGTGDVVSGLTTPENLALLGVAPEGKLAQRLIAGVFLGQSLLGTPEQWQALKSAQGSSERTRIATEMGLGLALPATGLAHSFKGEVPKVVEPVKTTQEARADILPISPESSVVSEPPQGYPDKSTIPQERRPSPEYPQSDSILKEANVNADNATQQNGPSVSRGTDAGAAPVPPKAKFVPSTVWQEVPEGTVLPNGGEYRFDQKSGKNFARWSQENLPTDSSATIPSSAPVSAGETLPETLARNREGRPEVTSQPLVQPEITPETQNQIKKPGSDVRAAQNTLSSQPETTPTGTKNAITSEPTARTFDSSESTGIAQRVHDQRGVDVEPGTGISGADSVQHGRELLKTGVDPIARLQEMKASGRLNSDDMAVLRAHHEELGKITNAAEDALRTNPSPIVRQTYERAWQAERGFAGEIKPFQTEWHKIGMAQQGETSLVDGSYSSLRRMVNDEKGRDVKPNEQQRLIGVAEQVKKLVAAELQKKAAYDEVVRRSVGNRKVKSAEELRAHFAEKIKRLLPCEV